MLKLKGETLFFSQTQEMAVQVGGGSCYEASSQTEAVDAAVRSQVKTQINPCIPCFLFLKVSCSQRLREGHLKQSFDHTGGPPCLQRSTQKGLWSQKLRERNISRQLIKITQWFGKWKKKTEKF